ncbi:unnamed protein product [Macrosiphum euphorbiae]|uniref:Uncharacterized protein n=1 Tax=Macrosiphum euphorbiae TaxID=13131 RepID=A0AAV0W0C6_9HEMI|nr:unnamed protein product [Macrosiphum euphorbiae]
MKTIDKRTDVDDCYGYMRLTHVMAVCWGLPITRRRTGGNERDGDPDVVRGTKIYYDEAWQQQLLPIFLVFLRYLIVNDFCHTTALDECGGQDYNIIICGSRIRR